MARTGEEILGVGPKDPLAQIALGLRELGKGFRLAAADRFTMSCFFALLLIAAGFGAIGLAWSGAASTLVVSFQLAYLASGGLGGLALLGIGTGILYLQTSRRLAAHEDREWAIVLDRALGILAQLKSSRAT